MGKSLLIAITLFCVVCAIAYAITISPLDTSKSREIAFQHLKETLTNERLIETDLEKDGYVFKRFGLKVVRISVDDNGKYHIVRIATTIVSEVLDGAGLHYTILDQWLIVILVNKKKETAEDFFLQTKGKRRVRLGWSGQADT